MPADNSNYDDTPAPPSEAAPGKPEPDADAGKGETALLPKSVFGHDLKPGDKCDVEVVSVQEDDYLVKGCEGHGEEKGGDESEPAAAPSQMQTMLED